MDDKPYSLYDDFESNVPCNFKGKFLFDRKKRER